MKSTSNGADNAFDYNDEIDESRSTLIKIILIVVLFSPFFSSAFIFLIFAGVNNNIVYILITFLILLLVIYSILHYKKSMETKNSLSIKVM
ncbi:MAG: hypothetical protein ACW99Q_05930 [Candidatus Kariarchaeaceae archaeon]|jgi:hypothetical protein